MCFRNGGPSIFLCDVCVLAERGDDEPVLYLWSVSQVGWVVMGESLGQYHIVYIVFFTDAPLVLCVFAVAAGWGGC